MGYVKSLWGRHISEVGLSEPDLGVLTERAVDPSSKPVIVNELASERCHTKS